MSVFAFCTAVERLRGVVLVVATRQTIYSTAQTWYNLSVLHKAIGRKMIQVVAALIWREGKFLICQRPESKKRAFLWEFVGGKVESGETKAQALVRECREELAITVKVNDEFCAVSHVYPDVTVQLTQFNAEIVDGEPQMLEHNDMRWITPSEIDDYEFCPADEEILKKLKQM